MKKNDQYVNEMDWGKESSTFANLKNYRKYQYDLIRNYVGKNILEVGSGDRSFTSYLEKENKYEIERIISIEPSKTLFDLYKNNYQFLEFVKFECIDLFDLRSKDVGEFDTVVFIHVLEHIERDKAALENTYNLLKKGGLVLIEVPALPWLYSIHDKMLGHFRRYNKKMLKSIIDTEKYEILKIWYQDPIGVIGSIYFFKIRKIRLKSDKGKNLVFNQGGIYDKYIIPFEKRLEKLLTFPFGLSLTAIIKKR